MCMNSEVKCKLGSLRANLQSRGKGTVSLVCVWPRQTWHFFFQGSHRPQENARLTRDLGIPDVGYLYLRKRFKLPVQSSGLHSLGGSSWQVPVVTKWWVLRGVALDFRTAPAPGVVPRTALASLPKADTWCWLAVPTAGAEAGPQQHPLCFTPHLPLPRQEICIPVKSSLDTR